MVEQKQIQKNILSALSLLVILNKVIFCYVACARVASEDKKENTQYEFDKEQTKEL